MSQLRPRVRIGRVLRNRTTRVAFGLYAIQAALLLVPLITLPYLTRVLGPANLGLLLFSQAFASLLTPLLGFGFEFSASRDIARGPHQRDRVRAIVSGVLAGKAVLALATTAVALTAGLTVPLFRDNPEYLLLAWLLGVLQGFSPLWYFLGRERIGMQASLELGVRVLAAAGIFLLVNDADDGAVVLLLQVVGTAVSVVVAHAVVYRQTGFDPPNMGLAVQALREGFAAAVYRTSVMVHQVAPPLLVGVISPPAQVGYYGTADKLQKVPITGLWPLSQALYPRINHLLAHDSSRALSLVKRTTGFFVGAGFAIAALLALIAPWLVPFLFGAEFESSVGVFRLLVVAVPFGLVAHVLTYQVLLPLGRDRVVALLGWFAVGALLVLGPLLAARFGAMGMAGAVVADSVLFAVGTAVVVAKEAPHIRDLGTMRVGLEGVGRE